MRIGEPTARSKPEYSRITHAINRLERAAPPHVESARRQLTEED